MYGSGAQYLCVVVTKHREGVQRGFACLLMLFSELRCAIIDGDLFYEIA